MTRTSDGPNRPSNDPSIGRRTMPAATNAPLQQRVLVVDTDRALLGLLEQWLDVCGCVAVSDQDSAAAGIDADGPFALAIVDVPHPRHGGVELLQRVAREHPSTPLIALSSTFFSGIESTGGVARTLGVACVLPKPVARDSLITAVRSLLHR